MKMDIKPLKITEAIILAGGLGTRLRPIISDCPKPLVLVAGRPFLDYLLAFFRSHEFRRVILSVGYRREQILSYFSEGYPGLELCFSIEESPLGTGGAIRKALPLAQSDWVMVANGDTFLRTSFGQAFTSVIKPDSLLGLLAVRVPDTARYGALELDLTTGNLKAFTENEQHGPGLINSGYYLVYVPGILPLLSGEPPVFSFESWLKKMIGKFVINVAEIKGDFIDIGTPEDYIKAQTLFAAIWDELEPVRDRYSSNG